MSQKHALNFEVTPPLSIRQYMANQIKNSKSPLVHYMSHESAGWVKYLQSDSQTLEREGCVLAEFHVCPLDVIRQVCDIVCFLIKCNRVLLASFTGY